MRETKPRDDAATPELNQDRSDSLLLRHVSLVVVSVAIDKFVQRVDSGARRHLVNDNFKRLPPVLNPMLLEVERLFAIARAGENTDVNQVVQFLRRLISAAVRLYLVRLHHQGDFVFVIWRLRYRR